MARNRTRGFTLLEVMIVVVIVGVLAAIALPAYQSQVRKAQSLRCATVHAGRRDNASSRS